MKWFVILLILMTPLLTNTGTFYLLENEKYYIFLNTPDVIILHPRRLIMKEHPKPQYNEKTSISKYILRKRS